MISKFLVLTIHFGLLFSAFFKGKLAEIYYRNYWVSDYQIAILRSYSYDVICITFERYVLKSE